MAEPLMKRQEKDVLFLMLNRPEKRNSLNPELVEHLKRALQEAEENPRLRAVVLTGAGKAFCAGADLAYLREMQHYSCQQNERDSQQLAELFSVLYHLPRITVAMVNGPALAGGCGLATVCDFIIADQENARFGYPEVRIGFIPALVANFLIRRIPPQQALELLISGKIFTASEAEKIGLVTKLVASSQLESATRQFVDDLLHHNSFQAMMHMKRLTHQLMDLPLSEGIRLASEENVTARYSQDCQKGLESFLQKKTISWRD